MPLTLDELKKKHDKAYNSSQVAREQASDDLVFYWVTQWDDQLLGDSQLEYRGEFNVLRKAGRQIMAELAANPVQPDFHPKDESREDDAEVMDMLYRADDRRLPSQEAYDFAKQDAVACGYGAWELYTEYKTNLVGDDKQEIHRRYIPEANNTTFWDPQDSSLAKSNANYVSCLTRYSEDAYVDLVKELTGDEDYTFGQASFKQQEQSYTFPWSGGQGEKIYVTTFYQREKVKDVVITLLDPFGEPTTLYESQVEEQMDELVDAGYELVTQKEIMRWEVRKYVASGEMILNGEINEETGEREGEVIAGEMIPVVPVYGEYVPQIEGEAYWCGITRLAKDPQRLRNFQMSYLADIVSRSPRPKPIFLPEQTQGYEVMYEDNGADNNYPYLLQNRKSANGEDLPLGPVGMMPEQPIPNALAISIDLSRQAVEDVANPGVPQDVADPDMSGKAILAVQNRIDQQSYIYQHNFKHAKKRDAEIYASMASEIFDTPRKLTVQTRDGVTKELEIMQVVIDSDTGEPKVLNDLTNMEFDVYADIGPSYESQKQQTIEQLMTLMNATPPTDPMYKILMMQVMEIMPGVQLEGIREYVRNQLIVMGIKKPETPEEEQMLMSAQQSEGQPDAMTLAAQAEIMKAQAAMAKEQRQAMKDQADTQISSAKVEIDAYRAQTDRAEQQVKAAEAGVNIQKTVSEKNAIDVDSQLKVADAVVSSYRATLN
jgi:hypothetical protein